MYITIREVVEKLGIDPDNRLHSAKTEQTITCPFCGKRKLSINTEKNVFRCWSGSCQIHDGGNAFDLYTLVTRGSKYKDLPPDQRKAARKEIFGLADDKPLAQRVRQPKMPAAPEIAPDEQLHKVYSSLLRTLKLSPAHRRELQERGLSDAQIERNRYKTLSLKRVRSMDEYLSLRQSTQWQSDLAAAFPHYTPGEKKLLEVALGLHLVNQMMEAGLKESDFCSVPGFFQFKNQWCLRVITGMVIPVRNIRGQIVGLTIHDRSRKAKYMSLSSAGLESGISAVSRVHCPLVNLRILKSEAYRRSARAVCITEGILKADVATALQGSNLKTPMFGVPGVDNLKELPGILRQLRCTTVFDAFDADKVLKPGVWKGSEKLRDIADRLHASYKALYWDQAFAEQKLKSFLDFCSENGLYQEVYSRWMTTPTSFAEMMQMQVSQTGVWAYIRVCAQVILQHPELKEKLPEDAFEWQKSRKGIDDELLFLHQESNFKFYAF